MHVVPPCIPCLVRQAEEAIDMTGVKPSAKEQLFRLLLQELAEADWSETPVFVAQRLHRKIRENTGNADPYRALKDEMNRTALALLPSLIQAIQKQPDPREAVVRLAIAGNLLDAGAKTRLEPGALAVRLQSLWHMPLIGNPDDLFQAADRASCILYLADNAGEIVFDRLLIEALPAEKITVAVRGVPIINDATLEDAEVAGIPEIAPVVANGSDAPGTLENQCSDEFRYWLDRADLVISKGQGNYECLSDTDRNTFFLLVVKCPMVSAEIGAPVGTLVVKAGGGSPER